MSKVKDVIKYFAQLKNLTSSKASIESDVWLKRMSIENLKEKKIEELSKGNQQKIQFICAIIHDPQLLVLDEPFSGFDPINQQMIKDLLLTLTSSGKIIILSTHQMETAEKLCSDILLINKGKEVCSGSLSQIKKNFAENHVRIGFEGDGTFLNSLPSVKDIDIYSNYAEVQLLANVNPSEFLKSLVDKISITHFSIIEPTLNQIFIDVIKQTSARN
jgi:ABC-2 type transport system ATP-binding protein